MNNGCKGIDGFIMKKVKKNNDHSHSHDHGPIQLDKRDPEDFELLERAIRELLIEKGLFTSEDVRAAIESSDYRTPADGAKVVARAWVDNRFKKLLLDDPKLALAEEGYDLSAPEPNLMVLEQTEETHHIVVCTLCSCYPRMLLGPPPDWYKSLEYRSRVVSNPREVLLEFGTNISPEVEIKVVDSTADLRYFILPSRPERTKDWNQEELSQIVTRDCMIGVANPSVT